MFEAFSESVSEFLLGNDILIMLTCTHAITDNLRTLLAFVFKKCMIFGAIN